ncbi:hypothetical protein TIFTF001_000596 [Ficus carica]|uniref:Uncharacterized protein n=1 Tax=Ficus carica TaxID=3494 RepID=A0AA87Z2N9_FICCA|nr:hypothetical protein TIFTF001_000596 [Ficus carica]
MENMNKPQLPPKRGQVLWGIIKSFTKPEKPGDVGNGGASPSSPSLTPAATPSDVQSESSGPIT